MKRFKKEPRDPKPPRSPYAHLWPELAYMPLLDHWPDRPDQFTPERSEILAYITDGYGCDLREAEKKFRSASYAKVIRFNPTTKLWCGVKGGERAIRKQSGDGYRRSRRNRSGHS